jgi:hypothetical protein
MRPFCLLLVVTIAFGAERGKGQFRNEVVPILTRLDAPIRIATAPSGARPDSSYRFSATSPKPITTPSRVQTTARLNRTEPAKSLLLTKPTYQLAHGGG